MIQHHGVATDITDIKAAAAQGILVATVPSQNSRSVAEHGMHLILALARRASLVRRLVAEGSMGEVECVELDGKTLCIVGFGTIGKMIAAAASGFGNCASTGRSAASSKKAPSPMCRGSCATTCSSVRRTSIRVV